MNMVDRNEMDDELDEPMASQSVDSEAPLTHNSSKNNFFASPDEQPPGTQAMAVPRGSFKNTVYFCSLSKYVLISHTLYFSILFSLINVKNHSNGIINVHFKHAPIIFNWTDIRSTWWVFILLYVSNSIITQKL